MSQNILDSEFLPSPFEWISIPNGNVKLHWATYADVEYIAVELAEFYISKYPITNLQYSIYALETGYQPKSKFALKHLDTKSIHPVVDIDWIEAMEFCEWISKKFNCSITLPTDAQWLYAAQGNDDRKYPWGNVFDVKYCNTIESQIQNTTPVTQYLNGASPFGVIDMIGNVCEWCLTDALTGRNELMYDFHGADLVTEQRLFAGSHFNSSIISSDVTRFGTSPISMPYLTGFRLSIQL